MSIIQIAAIVASSILFTDVFAGQLHFIRDVNGLENYLACTQGYKPSDKECGDYIEQPGHDCYSDPTSEVFCLIPSTRSLRTGIMGEQQKCVPRACIVENRSDCDRSSPSSRENCTRLASAASHVKRHKAYFMVGNSEKKNTEEFCNKKGDGNDYDCYELPSFRISCESDVYEPGQDYGGAIVYDIGTYPSGKAGYVILRKNNDATQAEYEDNVGGRLYKEGTVHGMTVHHRFKMNPSKLIDKYHMKIAGFAYKEAPSHLPSKRGVGFNSNSLNADAAMWKFNERSMVEDEKVVVRALVKAWKANGIAKTYWAMDDAALEEERNNCKVNPGNDADERKNCRKALRSWNPKVSLIPFICDVLTEMGAPDNVPYKMHWYPECM